MNKHYCTVYRPSYIFAKDKIISQNALTQAVSEGNIECVELLIKAGATVNKVGHEEISALQWAFQSDNVTCANLLIKAGAHVNGSGNNLTPLYYASTQKANACLDLLLRSGADVNATDIWGTTELMRVRDEKCCRLLLKHHSTQINKRDRSGHNALTIYMLQCDTINRDLCSLLFAAGETVPQTISRNTVPEPKCVVDCLPKSVSVIEYLPQIKIYFYLTELCREAIRKHLLELDPHTNLFDRILRLGLPKPLIEYLLFHATLDSSYPENNDTK